MPRKPSIVASERRMHKEAREILERAGIDINDAFIGKPLPSNMKLPKLTRTPIVNYVERLSEF